MYYLSSRSSNVSVFRITVPREEGGEARPTSSASDHSTISYNFARAARRHDGEYFPSNVLTYVAMESFVRTHGEIYRYPFTGGKKKVRS